jgi:hypothetical protein
MPTIEVDEAELLRSQQARKFVESIWNNPKARRKLLEAQKEVKPDDPMVKALDEPEPYEEQYKALRKELEDEKKARIESDAERKQEAKLSELRKIRNDGLEKLRGEYRYTADGLKAVEEIMEKKGILDPLDAAAIFERDHPQQAPIASNSSGAWNFMEPVPDDSEDLKKLIDTKGENNPLLDKMTREALMEIRGSAQRR